jgi:branched-chain amino acid transport system permease protein
MNDTKTVQANNSPCKFVCFLKNKFFLILGLLLFLIAPLFVNTYEQHILIMVAFYAFTATAWNIVCGFLGVLSLGHAVYVGMGGYISTLFLLYADLSPWIGMFIGAAVTCIFGLLIAYPCFRLKGPYFTLTSIALGEILRIWVENNEKFFGIDIKGSMGLLLQQTGYQASAFEFQGKLTYYYVILTFLIIAISVAFFISRNKLGYYFVAIRSDASAAESLGIPLIKYKLIAMGISVFLIAFAGTFYAQYFRYIGPTRIFGTDLSIQIALPSLVGGQGTVFGPLFGAVLLVPLTELLSEHLGGTLPGLHLFVYGVAMMLVVFFMPRGIHDDVMRVFKWVEKKLFDNAQANA